jgi:hypothetical protein
MWELYNFATFAMKETHPSLWMNNHIKAHEFFVTESGILVDSMNKEIVEPTPFTQLEMF